MTKQISILEYSSLSLSLACFIYLKTRLSINEVNPSKLSSFFLVHNFMEKKTSITFFFLMSFAVSTGLDILTLIALNFLKLPEKLLLLFSFLLALIIFFFLIDWYHDFRISLWCPKTRRKICWQVKAIYFRGLVCRYRKPAKFYILFLETTIWNHFPWKTIWKIFRRPCSHGLHQ